MNEHDSRQRATQLFVFPSHSSAARSFPPDQAPPGPSGGPRIASSRVASHSTWASKTAKRLSLINPSAGKLVHQFLRDAEGGGALVEFALVFPVFIVMILAIVNFGLTMNNYMQLTNAVNIAGRQLAISRNSDSTDPCSDAANAFYAAAPGLTKANLQFSITVEGTSYSTPTCTAAASTMTAGGDVTITVQYPPTLTFWGKNFAPNRYLSATMTELVQ